MSITIGAFNLKDAVTQFKERYIKGTATQVIDGDTLIFFLIKAIGQGCSRRLVDDTQYVKPRNATRVPRCLALSIVKVRRNGNHGLHDTLAQVSFGIGLKFLQDHCRNFWRAVCFPLDLYPGVTVGGSYNLIRHQTLITIYLRVFILSSHKAFDGVDRIFRVSDGLAFGNLTDETLTALVDSHNRGCCACSFRIRYNDGLAGFHNGNTRVCCS